MNMYILRGGSSGEEAVVYAQKFLEMMLLKSNYYSEKILIGWFFGIHFESFNMKKDPTWAELYLIRKIKMNLRAFM